MNRNKKDLVNWILKKKVYMILITLIFMVTGISYSLTNVQYVASQKVLVGEESSHLIDTYQEMMKGSTTLGQVIQNLGLQLDIQKLSEKVEVSRIENTNMIEIKVFGEEETMTQNISNELLEVFIAIVNDIYGNSSIYKVDYVANYYTKTNTVVVGIGSAMVGFVVSSLFFGMVWLLDTKVKSCKNIEEITGLKSLISIPYLKLIAKRKLNIKNIRAHKSEVFKLLMTNIQFVNTAQLQSKSILVTSPHSLEGKTYVATNLAIEFAKAGKKVILIDADMRKGRIAKIFNLPNELGFSNYLSHLDSNGNVMNERITRFIHDTEIKNLSVMTAGNIPPNPLELLGNNRLEELMKDLKIFYDVVLFDTVSLLESQEAGELSKRCDLTLILSSYGKTKKEELMLAYQQVSIASKNSIGVAFNKVPETRLKKKLVGFKNGIKKTWSKVSKKGKSCLKRLGNILKKSKKLIPVFQMVFGQIGNGLVSVKKMIDKGIGKLKSKSQEVKEYIQKYKKKKESIKLIEAGSVVLDEETNIIKEVFEEKIAELQKDEVEYKKKLDTLKANIETKNSEIPKVRPVVAKQEFQEKSKFDLIREQQEKQQQEKVEINSVEVRLEVPKQEERKTESKSHFERVEEPIKVEKEESKLEDLERCKKEERELRKQKIAQYDEIDLSKQEVITEEMIRMQVEMDEMIRLAEKEEEEEALRMKQRKKEERIRKMEARLENKIQKKKQKSENKARIEKEREEKRVYQEMQRQKAREELRIKEELQEDNLYPRPRI